MPNPHGSFIWYELLTKDAKAAKTFYDAVVGWNIDAEPAPGGMDYRMINAPDSAAGGVMQLNDDMLANGAKPVWLGYIGVDDVDASVAKVVAAGGKVHLPAFDIPDVGRLAMVADPQGNPLYLMDPIPPEGQPDAVSDVFSVDGEQRVGWNELTTPDPDTARAYYGELFGWTSDEFMPMGELGEYRFFQHHGVPIGAVCRPGPGGSQAWRYYFRVPSISKAVAAVSAGGGQVTMGPHEVPGGDQIIIGNDPQGAEFALVGKA